MTTLRKIAIAAGAGDPDPALALRIDVVAAAQALVDTMETDTIPSWAEYSRQLFVAQERLRVAVKRYRAACLSRKRELCHEDMLLRLANELRT